MKNPYSSKRFAPWWLWIVLVSVLFIVYFYYFTMGSMPHRYYRFFHLFVLSHERNYAAWWSGMCLLIAALLFYRLASLQWRDNRDRIMWATLAFIMAGLSLDEIGSLHERLSLIGGWWLLAPFGIAGIGTTLYSFWRLVIVPEYRVSAFLVLIGLGIFVGVAGLEFVEHNVDISSYMRRVRAVAEEGVELLGMFLFIVAGYRQLNLKSHNSSGSLLGRMQVNDLGFVKHILFFGLMLEITLTISMDIDPATSGRGSPLSWFPSAVFFMGFVHCIHQGNCLKLDWQGWLWWLAGFIFLFASMGQLINHSKFIAVYFDIFASDIFRAQIAGILWIIVPAMAVMFLLALKHSWGYIVLAGLSFVFFYVEPPPGNIFYVVSSIAAVASVKCLSEIAVTAIPRKHPTSTLKAAHTV